MAVVAASATVGMGGHLLEGWGPGRRPTGAIRSYLNSRGGGAGLSLVLPERPVEPLGPQRGRRIGPVLVVRQQALGHVHDALDQASPGVAELLAPPAQPAIPDVPGQPGPSGIAGCAGGRSEEHTSELQSRRDLVCRLLLEKKKKKYNKTPES